MTFLAVIIDMVSISFIYPIFATHIHNKFKLNPEIISLFFIIETITYFFALQILNTVNKKLGNKLTMVLGTLLNGTFILMLTPIRYLPQNSFTVVIGLAGLGIAGALVSIPAVIDIIETMKHELHIEEHTAQDYSSAIFNLGYFIGETIGPLLGGTFTDKYGFENACNINSAFNYMFGFSFGMVVYQQLALVKVIKSKRKLSKCVDVNSNCGEYMKLNDDRNVEFDV
jgi:MFS family permease